MILFDLQWVISMVDVVIKRDGVIIFLNNAKVVTTKYERTQSYAEFRNSILKELRESERCASDLVLLVRETPIS